MLHQRKFNHAHQVEKFMVSIQQKVNRKDKVKVAYKKKNICGLLRVWMREESNNTILLWFSITSDMYTVILRVGWGEEARKSSFNRDLWVVAPWWVMSILCLLAVNLLSQEFAISSHCVVVWRFGCDRNYGRFWFAEAEAELRFASFKLLYQVSIRYQVPYRRTGTERVRSGSVRFDF